MAFALFTGPLAWAVVIPGVIGLLYLLRLRALPKPFPGIPYNKEAANRIFGDINTLIRYKSRRTWFVDNARHHNSPLFQIFFLPFAKPVIVCVDPSEVLDISLRRTKEFKRNSLVASLFGGVIPNHHICMADDDPRFKKNRELVRDLMTPAFLNEVSAPQIYEKATRLVDLWTEKLRVSKGRPFAAGKDVHNLALDIILSVAFNTDPSTTNIVRNIVHFEKQAPVEEPGDEDTPVSVEPLPLGPEHHSFSAITESIGVAVKSSFPKVRHWFLRREPHLKDALAHKDEMTHRELAEAARRLEEGVKPKCAMDQILLREQSIASKEGRAPNYYSDTIKDELLGYLVGGHDTTSSSLQWGLKFLSRDQAALTRLRNDLHASFPDARAASRPPTVTEILKTQVPFLDAIMEEILRCSKTLPITSREARVDTQILGHHVPKGTQVFFLAHGPGYLMPAVPIDEKTRTTDSAKSTAQRIGVWDAENVAEFRPERWMKRDKGEDGVEREYFDANAGPFATFGHGPRACFGKRLAYMEMRILLCLLAWHFNLDPVKGEWDTSEPIEDLTTVPVQCYVKLREF
ncbi:Cytochrome P450 monooxygenase TRI13 [Colletotrichum sidae]|uniref:Cytochrome P450 monooxygenase TRI13 n=1 Tax=Colletotrichum sidae TaxID=1347389 RepID=A0A4V3I3E5_9PEZI|nr:Cytochrome P450 monooxygenase TRI13 [Colletotrichum sidae]